MSGLQVFSAGSRPPEQRPGALADGGASAAFDEELAYLDYVLDDIWDMLAQGVRVAFAAAHTPTLATIRRGFPATRTVVLRGVSRSNAMLLIHTDLRSDKVRELSEQPACSLHIHDGGRRVQLRVEAQAGIHVDDGLADSEWARRQAVSRGRPATGPEIGGLDAPMVAPSREHFAVLALHVARIEWLHLSPKGHRRAGFEIGERTLARWLPV